MRRGFLSTLILPLAVALGALLGGCGAATKTVSVASAPPAQSTGTTTTRPTTTTTSTSTTPTTTSGAPTPTTTRTAPEPAFTHPSAGSTAEGLSGAEAVLQAKGFTASATSDYHANQTLRVLVGTRTGGSGQQAFFFVGNRYIGTDAKRPSAQVRVLSQGDTEVTLAYSLSGSTGASAGQANVRFQLDNGKLVPLDSIPPESSRQ